MLRLWVSFLHNIDQISSFLHDQSSEPYVRGGPRSSTEKSFHQQIIDDKINPSVASHGGFVSLIDVKDNVAYVQFGGGCQGCGMIDVTLKQGVEVLIKEAVPEIEQIRDITDHADGTNPYYQPSK